MNILSIGNSFSQDAQKYLHRIAKADGCNLNTFNLYIGGCPLSLHYSGNDVKNNTFCDFDEEISKSDMETAKECVAEICGI